MSRIEKIQKKVDLAFIINPVDIFYLTGERVSKGKLFIAKTDFRLFVDGRYIEKCRQNTSILVELDTQENIDRFLAAISFEKVYLNGEILSYRQFNEFVKYFPNKEIIDTKLMKDLRMVKDSDEIVRLEKSAALNYAGYKHLRKFLIEGITEKEVAWEFEKYCRENGASEMAFPTTIAFGEHTSLPHHNVTNKKLKLSDPILIDIGVVLDGYTSDMTRSFCIEDQTDEYEKIKNLVKMAFDKAQRMCKPGIKVLEIDGMVREFFKENGVEDKFMHSLGHSLGLQVHEQPIISSKEKDAVLLENMVITIEPGLYFAGKWGYRYEDTLLITQSGVVNFYKKGES